MDAKEILRLAIKHRFWISVGVAALLVIIAPLITLGSINEKIAAKTAEIEGAKSGVEKYTVGTKPNGQYPEYTSKRIAELQKDVNAAWTDLYNRQAPLLDWPSNVKAEFQKWGRAYPKDEAPNTIRSVAYDYTRGYDDFLKKIYASFKPWDPVEGTGIVVAPPLEILLEKQKFDPNDPPTLTKIWSIQDNLWVRGSMLDVVAKVNERAGARDWETAPIKKINSLIVGTPLALDHKSLAKGEVLKDPTPLEPDAAAGSSAAAPTSGGDPSMAGANAQMEAFMGQSGSSSMMMGSPGMGAPTKIQYLQPQGVDQYRIYPAVISVLIDQNYIQDFLAQFENSPMSIQVKEVNWNRPKTRVKKPEKGEALTGFGTMGGYGMGMGGGLFGDEMMAGMMGGMGQMAGMMGRGGYGPDYEGGMMGGMGQMAGMMGRAGMMPGGGRGGLGAINQPRTKVSRADELKKQLADKKKSEEGKEEEPKKKGVKTEIFDPYYNVVELQVYTQARFYEPPPPPPAEEPTPTVSPGAEEPPADATTPPADETTPAPDAPSADATTPAGDATPPSTPEAPEAPKPPAPPEAQPQPAPAPATEAPAPAPAPAGDTPPPAPEPAGVEPPAPSAEPPGTP